MTPLLRRLLPVLAALLVAAPAARSATRRDAEAATSLALYDAGRASDARTAFARELREVERRRDPAALWAQLQYGAWLEESLGEPQRSLALSTRALRVAVDTGDPFRIGRSLCWLGWSSASLGLYALALDVFDRAIEIGAPGGRVEHVAVWGLATQEKGWVLARMGRLAEGRSLIEETTAFARANRIDVGVAEGAAHLAEIALEEGQVRRAEELADEAVRASIRCDCRPANTARARVIAGKAALARATQEPRLLDRARETLEEALRHAQSVSAQREVAEAKLLLARALPAAQAEARIALAADAVEVLDRTGSDLRGRAHAELGRALAAAELEALARAALEAGLELSDTLLRRLDGAYALTDLAELDRADGSLDRELGKRAEAAERALESGAWALALQNQEALSAHLYRLGRSRQSLDWTERALGTLETMLRLPGDAVEQAALLARKATLLERRGAILLAFTPLAQEPPALAPPPPVPASR